MSNARPSASLRSLASSARCDGHCAAPYVHSKLAQVDVTAQNEHNHWNIVGVRFWTEEEWLAHRDAASLTSLAIRRDLPC
jgi:hypothetical protein